MSAHREQDTIGFGYDPIDLLPKFGPGTMSLLLSIVEYSVDTMSSVLTNAPRDRVSFEAIDRGAILAESLA